MRLLGQTDHPWHLAPGAPHPCDTRAVPGDKQRCLRGHKGRGAGRCEGGASSGGLCELPPFAFAPEACSAGASLWFGGAGMLRHQASHKLQARFLPSPARLWCWGSVACVAYVGMHAFLTPCLARRDNVRRCPSGSEMIATANMPNERPSDALVFSSGCDPCTAQRGAAIAHTPVLLPFLCS